MLYRFAQSMVPFTRGLWPTLLERLIKTPQPAKARGRIIFTFFTRTGLNIDGKLTFFEFFPTFLGELRRLGFETRIVLKESALEAAMEGGAASIVVHVFGEDHGEIGSSLIQRAEERAALVFNSAQIGPLLSDKLAYHQRLDLAGIAVPDLVNDGGFVRERLGTMRPTAFGEEAASVPSAKAGATIRTRFVDTVVAYEGAQYYTTVRLLCIDDIVLHAYTRARDTADENASVHAKDTPLDPPLIAYLHKVLVEPNREGFAAIARGLFGILGHGFFVHDLLIEQGSGAIMVCESGIKFDDMAYWKHINPIADQLPSEAPILPLDGFARRSAGIFAQRCMDGVSA